MVEIPEGWHREYGAVEQLCDGQQPAVAAGVLQGTPSELELEEGPAGIGELVVVP